MSQNLFGKDAWVALAVFVACVFIYNFYMASHETPKYSEDEIYKYGYGVVVSLLKDIKGSVPTSQELQDSNPVASGWWVDRYGHMLTCCMRPCPRKHVVQVSTLVAPMLFNEIVRIPTGLYRTGGMVLTCDDSTGIALVWVQNNPFKRTVHPGASVAQSHGDKPTEIVTEQYHVPVIASSQPVVGMNVFLVGIEAENESPSLTIVTGEVNRIGLTEKDGASLRLFTSIPFKQTFRGAPVFNSSREIIGIVGDSKSEVEIIPAMFARGLLHKEGIDGCGQ